MYEIPENLAHTQDKSKVVLESSNDAFYVYLRKGQLISLEKAEKEGILSLFEKKEMKQLDIETKAVTPENNLKIENKQIKKPVETKTTKVTATDEKESTESSKS